MKILAIDTGTKCGWALYSRVGSRRKITSGMWPLQAHPSEGGGKRYHQLYMNLQKLSGVDIIVYEEVMHHDGVYAAHVYGAIEGIILLFCEQNEIRYGKIGVGTWKKETVGKGNVNQEQYLAYALKRWPDQLLALNSYDQAAALGVLECQLKRMGIEI